MSSIFTQSSLQCKGQRFAGAAAFLSTPSDLARFAANPRFIALSIAEAFAESPKKKTRKR
jgi:hypothetical protein